jgi:hypothetical protein
VERWFADLTEKQIRRGTHRSTRALEDAIRLYVKLNNENPQPFVWLKTADEILASIARRSIAGRSIADRRHSDEGSSWPQHRPAAHRRRPRAAAAAWWRQ